MRKMFAGLGAMIGLVILAGCLGSRSPNVQVTTDWSDFAVTSDGTYIGLGNAILSDPEIVKRGVVATVRRKLQDQVDGTGYTPRVGDAAFLKKGTKFYAIRGFEPEDVLVTPSKQQIGGYKVYVRDGFDGLPAADLERFLADNPVALDVYLPGETEPLRRTSGTEALEFAELLGGAVHRPGSTSGSERTPLDYLIVPDNGEPILYSFWLADNGAGVYMKEDWPVDGSIRKFLSP